MFQVKLPQFVEVETHSFCNRTCLWCPNGWNNRGRSRNYMDNAVWELILRDLRNADYSGWFAFHNFNEPLTDPTIFDKIEQAKYSLRNARLHLFTNGDYLTEETLDALRILGVHKIRISLYPTSNKKFDEPESKRITNFVARLGLPANALRIQSKRHLNGYIRAGSTQLHFIAPRIEKHYRTRGGSVLLNEIATLEKRTQPCFLPFRTAAIDYLGNLKLCSEIFDSRNELYKNHIIGNVAEDGFLNLWFSFQMNKYRRLTSQANFDDLIGCQNCTFRMPQDRLNEMQLPQSLSQDIQASTK